MQVVQNNNLDIHYSNVSDLVWMCFMYNSMCVPCFRGGDAVLGIAEVGANILDIRILPPGNKK